MSNEQNTEEADFQAVVLQLERNNRLAKFKVAAGIVLLFTAFTLLVGFLAAIPDFVNTVMGVK